MENKTPQTRKLRAQLNRMLQPCTTVEDIRAKCLEFQTEHGSTIWFVPTGHNGELEGPYAETFRSLAQAHLGREVENAEWRQHDKEQSENILSLIQGCGVPEWYNLKAFVDKRPELLDRSDVTDALEERREYLQLPLEEEE